MDLIQLESGDRLAFEGDSLTEGRDTAYGRMMGWHRPWPQRVDEWLLCHRPTLRLESRQFAVGGSDARALLARVEAVVAFRPTVVLATIGTHDAFLRVPLETYRDHLDAWCTRLRENGAARIGIVGGFPACPNADQEMRRLLKRAEDYDAASRDVLEGHDGCFLDVGPYLLARAEALDQRWPHHTIYAHGIDYNALGHELIAGAVLTRLGFWPDAAP